MNSQSPSPVCSTATSLSYKIAYFIPLYPPFKQTSTCAYTLTHPHVILKKIWLQGLALYQRFWLLSSRESGRGQDTSALGKLSLECHRPPRKGFKKIYKSNGQIQTKTSSKTLFGKSHRRKGTDSVRLYTHFTTTRSGCTHYSACGQISVLEGIENSPWAIWGD